VDQRPGRRSLGGIAASSAIAALVTWLLHVVAGRTLGTGGYAHFMVVWGLFFTLTGVLQGLQQEVTRSVTSARRYDVRGDRTLVGTLVVGVAGAVLLLLTSPLWASRILEDDWLPVTAVMAAAFVAYALANQVNGAFAGRGSWRVYAWAILLEGLLRAAFVLAVLLVDTSATWWALALVGGALGWALLAVGAETRRAFLARGDGPTSLFLAKAVQAMVAAGCSALVVAGFPVLLDLSSGKDLGADAGVVLAVLVATRAPVLLSLNAYQGVLITQLVASPAPGRLLWRWVARGLLLAVPAGVLGYAVGPTLLPLVFGADFVAPGRLFAGLVASTCALAVLTLTGWTTLALGRHLVFVGGWLLATVATFLVLLLPLNLADRASLALLLGPLAGVAVHAAALGSRSRRERVLAVS
jgi:O-antigen/teichoic acid export membrane protein